MTLLRSAARHAAVARQVAAVEFAIRRRPLPALCDRLGVRFSTVPAGDAPQWRTEGEVLRLHSAEIRRLRALDRVMRRWPFGAGPCLRQSLVAGQILRSHGPELRIGVALDGTVLQAHAWLEVDGVALGEAGHFAALTAPAE